MLPQPGVSFRAHWIACQSLFVRLARLTKALEFLQAAREIRIRPGRGRIRIECSLVPGESFAHVALLLEGLRHVAQDQRVAGIEAECLSIRLFRLVKQARFPQRVSQVVVRLRQVWLQRRRAPAMFEGGRPLAEIKQELAQVRVGFAISGSRLYGAPEGRQSTIPISEQTQRVAEVVERDGKAGAEPYGLRKEVARLRSRSLLQKNDTQVVQPVDVAWIDPQRRPAGLGGMPQVSQAPVGLAQVGIKVGITRNRDRPQDSLDRERGLADLHGEDPGKMKCVGIIGLVLEHLLVKPISFAEAPLLLVCQRLLQDILDGEFHGVVRSRSRSCCAG